MDTRGYEFTSDRNGNVYTTRVPQPWRLVHVNRLIDEVRRELLRREHPFLFNPYSAKSCERAWAKNPDLVAREKALFVIFDREIQYRERMAGKACAAEQRRRAKEARAESRRQFEASKCPTCGAHTLNNLARAA